MIIEPMYRGCHAILAAPGPSLTEEVVEILRENKHKYAIFGVGDAYRRIDFLDELYACDARWWKIHGKEIKKTKVRSWCYDEEGTLYGANKIEGMHLKGLSKNKKHIHFGGNSGYQLLNLAYLWGCSKMILVGYNMKKVNDQSHFFQDRHPTLNTNSPYNIFVQKYATIQPEIKNKIVNCTPDSALNMFRHADLLEEL